MLIDPIEEKVLTDLGLTSQQARVYLALAHRVSSKAIALSQATGIHRTHVYEVLKSLEEKGFVEKQLDSAIYTPIPLKEVSEFLVKNKRQEITQLEKVLNEIAESLPQKNRADPDRHWISITSNKNSSLNKGLKYIGMARVQIDQMHTWRRFTQLWAFFGNAYADALSRGVKIRQIIEYPPDRQQALKVLSAPEFSHDLLEVRFIPKTGGNITIIDNEKFMISTSQSKENLGETPLLTSDYEGLMGVMQNYFDYSWRHASNCLTNDCVCTVSEESAPASQTKMGT